MLFYYVEDQRLPLVTTTLCLLLWKFTLIDFYSSTYRVDIDNVTFKADDVWTATLTRPTRPCGRLEMRPYPQPPAEIPLERS